MEQNRNPRSTFHALCFVSRIKKTKILRSNVEGHRTPHTRTLRCFLLLLVLLLLLFIAAPSLTRHCCMRSINLLIHLGPVVRRVAPGDDVAVVGLLTEQGLEVVLRRVRLPCPLKHEKLFGSH